MLGDKAVQNSIGKSTFLLVVDFALAVMIISILKYAKQKISCTHILLTLLLSLGIK